MTCIDPQTRCALFNSLTIQQFFASTMNRLLVGVDNWPNTNRFSLNIGKTSYMIISKQKKAFDIKIRESTLTNVSTVKFLGVTLDENLTFNDHVNKVMVKYLSLLVS